MATEERGKHTPGIFVWRELYTANAEDAKRFYSEVFGWRFETSDMGGGMLYHLAYAGDKQIAGIFEADPKMGIPPMWNPYVSVNDVDATSKVASENGGKVINGPMDIPNIGRMSTVLDPQGACISLYRDAKGDAQLRQPKFGEFCWESLNSTDLNASKNFYTKVVGWDAGKVTAGEVFTLKGQADAQTASYNPAPPGQPASWLCHVLVSSLKDTTARATRNGGKILMDNVPVPNMGNFAVLADPQGAVFSVFEPSQK